jgi:endonuclease YncB( thermonuclease family)
LAAKDRLIELLTEVSSKPGFFRIKSYGEGKYGRVLAELFIMDKDGNVVNVNQTLITEGHAHEYDGGKRKEFK